MLLRSHEENHVRSAFFAAVPTLCLAVVAFLVAQTQMDSVRGFAVTRKAAPVSLRLSRLGAGTLNLPVSPDSFVAAIQVATAVVPAPELAGRLGQATSCAAPPAAALSAPSCRAPPSP